MGKKWGETGKRGRSRPARSCGRDGAVEAAPNLLVSAAAAAALSSGALARSSAQSTGGRGGLELGKDTAGSAS